MRKAHGYCDCRKAGLWGKNLAVVPSRACYVAYFAGRIAPGRVNDCIQVVTIHGGQQRIAKGDLGWIAVNIRAWCPAIIRRRLRVDGALHLLGNVRQVQTRRHNGLEVVVWRVRMLRKIAVQVFLKIAAP